MFDEETMTTPRLTGPRATLLWVLPGALVAVGVLSLGWLALLPAIGLVALFVRHLARWPEALGASAGAALVLLGIAFHRVRAPGLDAAPWALAGVGLLGISLLLYLLTRPRSGDASA